MRNMLTWVAVAFLVILLGMDGLSKLEAIERRDEEIEILKTVIEQHEETIQYYEGALEDKDASITALQQNIELLISTLDIFNIDVFSITAYSPFDDVNGLSSDGNPNKTATGTKPRKGTVAVDPKVVPYGSKIIIIYADGTIEHGRAEDTGGAIKKNRLDVFRNTYSEAIKFGRQQAVVIWY